MIRASRVAYFLLSWAFVVGLLAQVFFIGLGIFGERSGTEVHRGFGWVLHLAPLLVLLFAALSRGGRRHWQWALALALVVFLVPIFATLRTSGAAIAALHPVAALVAFVLAVVVAVNALAALRTTAAGPESDDLALGRSAPRP